jgi:hypothetical protein
MTPSGIDPATFRFVAQWDSLYVNGVFFIGGAYSFLYETTANSKVITEETEGQLNINHY